MSDQERARAPRQVKSARRTAQILELVASTPSGMSLADVARALGLPRSSAHALLSDMTESRLLEAKPSSASPRYRIGLLTFQSGSAFLRQRNLADEARTIVERLAARTDENAHLAILDGRDIIYIAKGETTNAMRVASYVGLRIPAHATAVGKVLLAQLDASAVLDLYAGRTLEAMTPRTTTRLHELLGELRSVATDGFAFDDEESTSGLQCLAVPVHDASGQCVAALSVSVPTMRMVGLDRSALLGVVQGHADELSARLGAVPARLRPRPSGERP